MLPMQIRRMLRMAIPVRLPAARLRAPRAAEERYGVASAPVRVHGQQSISRLRLLETASLPLPRALPWITPSMEGPHGPPSIPWESMAGAARVNRSGPMSSPSAPGRISPKFKCGRASPVLGTPLIKCMTRGSKHSKTLGKPVDSTLNGGRLSAKLLLSILSIKSGNWFYWADTAERQTGRKAKNRPYSCVFEAIFLEN
jgi:hypothetical protein